MTTRLNQIATWSVDHRWTVWLLHAVITAIAVLGFFDPHFFQAESQSSRSDDSETDAVSVRDLPNVSPFSLSQADVVIVVQGDDFFTPESSTALRSVVDELEALHQVRQVIWMDRVPVLNVFGLPQPLLPSSKASAARFAASRAKAQEHPLVGGQLLSEDTSTLLMLVTLDFYHVFDDSEATDLLRETAAATAAEYPEAGLSFQVTGQVPAQLAAITAHEANQFKYQAIGYGMILLMTVILFRGIRAVVIVAAAPAAGVFWTLGFIRFLDFGHNPLIDVILPILISLVGLTDSVHLMVQIRKLRASGLSSRDSARRAIQVVGLACLLTSLTTAIGFGSLTLASSEWVWEFGVCSVVGVCLTFLSVVTVIPLLCSTWIGRNIHAGQENSLIERNLGRISGLIDHVLRRRSVLSAAAIVATLLLFFVCLTLTPDQRRSDGLPENAEATIALQHMDKVFGGLEFSRVEVRWTDNVPSDSADVLMVVTEIDDLLRTEDLIGHPLSIRNLIDAQPGSGPPVERMSLLELLPPPLKRAFYTPERNSAQITFRVEDLGIAAYGPVFERVEQGLAQITQRHPEFETELRGEAVWRWRNLFQVVMDLARSLGSASVIIFLVLSVVYRSFRIGLISIIPNVFPLVLTGGYLAVAGYNLEIVMVCNFTVCLGIAVDDTIHFLTRYLEESHFTEHQDVAIRNAFTGVGTALIMTTTVLVVGFATVTFSESRDHRIFAVMGVLTIGSALFADLIFLPALLSRFDKEFHQRGTKDESSQNDH